MLVRVALINDEEVPLWANGRADFCKEGVYKIGRDVREPKREEYEIVVLVGAPLKQILLPVLDARIADPLPVDLDHLRRSVYRGHRLRDSHQLLRPITGPGSQFKGVFKRPQLKEFLFCNGEGSGGEINWPSPIRRGRRPVERNLFLNVLTIPQHTPEIRLAACDSLQGALYLRCRERASIADRRVEYFILVDAE